MPDKPLDLDDFRRFFAEDFQWALESTIIPGMEGASWDRRAAYLWWLALGNPELSEDGTAEEDDFGGLV